MLYILHITMCVNIYTHLPQDKCLEEKLFDQSMYMPNGFDICHKFPSWTSYSFYTKDESRHSCLNTSYSF